MKKLASLVLALVLCAGLALPALAAEGLPPDLEADMAADRGTDPGAGPEAGLGTLPEGVPKEVPAPGAETEAAPGTPPAEGEGLPAVSFADVPEEHSFYAAIMDCAAKGITAGYADGTFRPTNPVTRAQFCVMLSRAFYPDAIAEHADPEGSTLPWFRPNTKALSTAGVLENTSFTYASGEPSIMDEPISRYDMAQLMTNIMAKKGFTATSAQKTEAQKKIADHNSIPTQYQDAVENVFALGIITGYANGTFGGSNVMNRGQGCVVIYRMMQYTPASRSSTGDTTYDDGKTETKPDTGTTTGTTDSTSGNTSADTGTTGTTAKTGYLTNGKPITEANVTALMDQLLAQYPHGTSFASGYPQGGTSSIRKITNQYVATSQFGTGLTSTTSGCAGWAAKVADYLYGQTGIAWRKTSFAYARPGDLVISRNTNGQATHVTIAHEILTASHKDIINGGMDWAIGGFYATSASCSTNNKADYRIGQNTYTKSDASLLDIYTCYPNDKTTSNLASSGSSDSTIVDNGDSTTTTTPVTPPASQRTCGFCGETNLSGGVCDSTRTKWVCNACYQADPTRAHQYVS